MTAPAPANVHLKMRAALPGLPPAEQRIARFCIDDPAAATLPITQLAAQCETSTTSIVRFYRRLGYEHFIDFRLDLTAETVRERAAIADFPQVTGDIDRDDDLSDIVSKVVVNETLSISDTSATLDIDALGRAVALVTEAREVSTFGIGASSIVGLDLQQKLTRIGRTALSWRDPHAAWTSAVTLRNDSVAIAISHSGRTPEVVRYLTLAREAGAATIAVTNFADSPLAEFADVSLITAARETPFRSGALGSRIAQLMVVDCLFIGVTQASYERSMAAIHRTYEALHPESGAQQAG
ncbi:MurR/RpiR family transcriptional regulator [Leucobacter sp. NPDC058333]|uniref:MurR/RpiR family transcriptional regulator n=1 Tax=Leucobacter sp. NPDC058333 TaxID=3346450 RepID=UPI00364DCE7D